MKKYAREIRVGVLAVIALFLLYFGFNFLKGVNIFSKTTTYIGVYNKLDGLVEQANVYVRGYKVGQVDKIVYDFTRSDAFTVELSIDRSIQLPQGTELALIQDGLLGGAAIEVRIPKDVAYDHIYQKGDTLPTRIEAGLLESLQGGLLAQVSEAVVEIDSLVAELRGQLQGDHIQNTLARVDKISADLQVSSGELKRLMQGDVRRIAGDAGDAVADLKTFAANLSEIDLASTIAQVDSVVGDVHNITAAINSSEGTLGLLLNDKELYLSLNGAIESADSLLVDLKAHPKRYVHFSLFGRKEK